MGTQWRLVVLAGLFTLVTACSGGGEEGGDGVASMSDGQTTSSAAAQEDDKTDDDRMREYASCMKEYGFEVGELGEGNGMPVGADKEKYEKADAECKKLLPNGGAAPGGMSGEDLDEARKLAQCLREHGLDVPDPDPAGDGPFMNDDTADQETIDKAMEACAPDGVGEGNG